ncbi:hypothetical protein ABT275_44795 [Streptomyces sp. NPDC001185]|uniref:hypothetical protein n=1 Tax=Streptomyces sp. NPDC001185 TaxID=3154380 RepID=UPI00332F42DE
MPARPSITRLVHADTQWRYGTLQLGPAVLHQLAMQAAWPVRHLKKLERATSSTEASP